MSIHDIEVKMNTTEEKEDCKPNYEAYYGLKPPPKLGENDRIPFSRPYLTGAEEEEIKKAFSEHQLKLEGEGPKARECERLISEMFADNPDVYLTGSCTQALEFASVLLNIGNGDEVIVPSFTFVSSANPFLVHGARIRFADIEEHSLNMNIDELDKLLTLNTRAVVIVHYAGFECNVVHIREKLNKFEAENGLTKNSIYIVEDAAHALVARAHDGTRLGSHGDLSCFSFHATKNVISGEGGALVVNNPNLRTMARVVRNKGTNRHDFILGKVDRYAWIAGGGSYYPSEITAAFLLAQLRAAHRLCRNRVSTWEKYYKGLSHLSTDGSLTLPPVVSGQIRTSETYGLGYDEAEGSKKEHKPPNGVAHPGHIFWVTFPNESIKQCVLEVSQQSHNVSLSSHYVPLHSSPKGVEIRRQNSNDPNFDDCPIADIMAVRLLRLPLWFGLSQEDIDRVIVAIEAGVNEAKSRDLYELK